MSERYVSAYGIKSGDRRDGGESYRAMLTRMAQESGIETPSAEDLARLDRKRKGKTLFERGLEEPDRP